MSQVESAPFQSMDLFKNKWEKRWHPLRQEWVVYAAHRNSRPWTGERVESVKKTASYDESCYLCPGNQRIGGKINPAYQGVHVFENDHPVVGFNAPKIDDCLSEGSIRKVESAVGVAKVICYHPRHDLSLATMPFDVTREVFDAFKSQMIELSILPEIKSVLIFENRGEMVGVSNPHPHCQLYAVDFVFELVRKTNKASMEYARSHGADLFESVIESEIRDEIRVVAQNEHAIAFVPFFARYAYEVMIFPRKRYKNLTEMPNQELEGLAQAFHQVICKYDGLFNMDFPYVMSILQAPFGEGDYDDFHLHILLQPPLRQPGLIKYLAGPEIGGGNFMADTMPEEKAAELNRIIL